MKLAVWARANGVHPQTAYRARNRALRAVTCVQGLPGQLGIDGAEAGGEHA